ncbi:MAG TPA: methyltransferase, TIGR04325 family [Spirochaetota bacterium]|nr:methyltransferase, TIGR04325 family [Spirochaetota bacterium]HPP04048.1 methyltransferase, TIGR04325 family [Spirochaetota bacterium]
MEKIKKILKLILPPIFLDFLRRINRYGWHGNYKTWGEASRKSTGYNNNIIFEKVKEASLKVKNCEAIYERDGCIFDKIEYSWQLLCGILYAKAKYNNLSILDFGGSLGTIYYQNRKFLNGLDLKWGIVEQKFFVDIGIKEFQDNVLRFYYDVDSCIKDIKPNVLIISNTIQYIENPYELLDKLLVNNFKIIIIDRTPFLDKEEEDKIKLQIVPPNIYKASYPCWIFNEKKFIYYFEKKGYEIIETFEDSLPKYGNFSFKGMIMEKKG